MRVREYVRESFELFSMILLKISVSCYLKVARVAKRITLQFQANLDLSLMVNSYTPLLLRGLKASQYMYFFQFSFVLVLIRDKTD